MGLEQLEFAFDNKPDTSRQETALQNVIDLAGAAMHSIRSVALAGHPIVVAWSSGKDSSVCLSLTLMVLKEMVVEGLRVPPLVILHADPLIDNPEVSLHARREMDNILAFAEKHELNVRINVSKPSLASSWAVKVLSGRNLPPLPGRPRDCTMDLKVQPMKKMKKQVMKEMQAEGYSSTQRPVTVIGTRFAESNGRRKRMTERGETSEQVWEDTEGLKLSPIADWSDGELWNYIYACANGKVESYGDFQSLIDLYLACATETRQTEFGDTVPVDVRTGCMVCTVGRDKSLEGMVAKGERYVYLRPLLLLQDFIRNTQFDLDRRQWIGRTINAEGYIAIGPDTYSPAMLAELLRYCLTIDVEEAEAAYAAGLPEPRYKIIRPESLIAIDAIWSQQGIHRPFEALRIYRDVYVEGNRYRIPELPKPKPVEIPEARYLYAGDGWMNFDESLKHQGTRNVVLEMVSENGSNGCMGTKTLKDGRIVMDTEMSDGEFAVDFESACLILDMELDYLLEKYSDPWFPRTQAFRYYSGMGTIQFAKGQINSSDLIVRRTAWKESLGLFDMSREELLAQTVSAEEMTGTLPISHPENCHQNQFRLLAA